MSKRLRSYLAVIMAALFAFAIVAVPKTAWAAEVYTNEDSSICVSTKDGGAVPQDIKLTVFIDSQQVASGEYAVPLASKQIHVTVPDGYSVELRGSNVTCTPDINGDWNLAFQSGEHLVDVSIASSKTNDDIAIQSAETLYGIFSWAKSDAMSSAYLRNVTINVDGVDVYTQKVATPTNLSNLLNENQQFWFTPNQELYTLGNVEYSRNTLDNVSMKDLTISLTTKCQCGNNVCMCDGECDCQKDCN